MPGECKAEQFRNHLTAVYSAAQSGGPHFWRRSVLLRINTQGQRPPRDVKRFQKRKAAPGHSISAANCISEINRKRA
jgi:hypothetical protein